MALSRVRRMERLRVSVETRAQISLGDARLRSERASGESLRKACPALLSVMSGFIRRDRGLNCINSRLFPIVFWWNLQPIKAAQLRREDSPRIPEDQLNKKEEEKKSQCLCHPSSLFPSLLLPLYTPSPLPSVSQCLSSLMVRTLWHWSALLLLTDRWRVWANYNSRERSPSPLPLFLTKKQIVNRSWIERLCNPSVYYIKTSCVSFISGWMLLKHV